MYHSPKWFHFTKNLESSLLFDDQDSLLIRHIKNKDIDSLSAMMYLQYIDYKICMFRSGLQMIRWIIFIPWFLGLLISATNFTSDFNESWVRNEADIIYAIDNFDNVEYVNELKEIIGDDKKLNFNEYLYYRYNEFAYGGEYLTGDIVMVLFHTITIPLCFYAAFLTKRKAPLALVRDRQLFMTWINGKAFVARYSQVGVVETPQAVSLILYGLDNKKNIIKTAFVLPTNPTIILSSDQGRKNILAFITQYMLWGQSAVASTNYKRNMPFYLRKDKKPDDFEQQVDQILAVLDKLESPRELNTLTDIKGN
ncbi:hypothetical protein F652_3325 [Enterobacteriaceae bacterium bta3-1]|nr:hypothetical protein F652_3325 [Enterobacteriaceae bacterium bta3-1]